MFCEQCGHELAIGTTMCSSCGTPTTTSPASAFASHVGEKVKSRSQDALKAVRTIATNPVAGLPTAFQSLEKRQAMEVGIAFAIAFDVCVAVGLFFLLPRWAGSPGFGDIVKFLFLGLVPFGALSGAAALARQVFHGSGGCIEGDLFIAGASLLPFGLVALLAGIAGAGNVEVTAIVIVFALSYTILILYTGCTRISQIAEVRAAPAVPVIVLVAGWVSKILFAAML